MEQPWTKLLRRIIHAEIHNLSPSLLSLEQPLSQIMHFSCSEAPMGYDPWYTANSRHTMKFLTQKVKTHLSKSSAVAMTANSWNIRCYHHHRYQHYQRYPRREKTSNALSFLSTAMLDCYCYRCRQRNFNRTIPRATLRHLPRPRSNRLLLVRSALVRIPPPPIVDCVDSSLPSSLFLSCSNHNASLRFRDGGFDFDAGFLVRQCRALSHIPFHVPFHVSIHGLFRFVVLVAWHCTLLSYDFHVEVALSHRFSGVQCVGTTIA